MAENVRGCNRTEPHEAHQWSLEWSLDDEWGKRRSPFYRCPGVPDDSVRPADILTFPTDHPAHIEVREDPFDGYSYDSDHRLWICGRCESYVASPPVHTNFHETLDRLIGLDTKTED